MSTMKRRVTEVVVWVVTCWFGVTATGVEVDGKVIPAEKFVVIIVMGDSNAQMGHGWPKGEIKALPNMWALDWSDKAASAPKWIQAGYNSCVHRGAPEQFKGGAGVGFPIAKLLAQKFPGYHFAYVNAALSTGAQLTTLESWLPGLKPYVGKVTMGAVVSDLGTENIGPLIEKLRAELEAPGLPWVQAQYRVNRTDPRYEIRGDGFDPDGGGRVSQTAVTMQKMDKMSTQWRNLETISTEGLNMGDNRHQKYWSGNHIYAERFVNKLLGMGWMPVGGKRDSVKPTAPKNLRIDRLWDRGVTVAWDEATDDLGVEGYEVSVDGTKVPFWPTLPSDMQLVTTVGTRFPITGLKQKQDCVVTVRARDYAGNVSDSSIGLKVHTLDRPVVLKLPLKVDIGGGSIGEWMTDKEFRDGYDYGYILSPAEQGDWEGRDYLRDPNDRKAPPWFFDAVKATYQANDARHTVFRTFRGGNTAYRFTVPDGRYRLTWYMEGQPDPADNDEKPYADGELAKLCRVKTQTVEATKGRLIQPLPGQGRGRVYALILEAAPQ